MFCLERKVSDDDELDLKNYIDISKYAKEYGIKIPVLMDEELWEIVKSNRILDGGKSGEDGRSGEDGKLISLIENIIPELMKCRTEGCNFDIYVYNDKENINRRKVFIKYILIGNERKMILAFK
ncbi:MAG: hypothetical protein PWQ77_289 [Kosmotogales bacterium]|nr:hypothetical protein [Kosmotogales bacterium]